MPKYGALSVPAVLALADGRFSLECEALGPVARAEVEAARSAAERRERVLGELFARVSEQVQEALPFDEPKTEEGQQDGKLRPEWRTAVREGEARWIRFYSDTWLMNLLENRKAAGLAPLMRQAVGITQISPRALPASAARMAIANTRRRVQSARSALRRRLAQRAGGPNGPA